MSAEPRRLPLQGAHRLLLRVAERPQQEEGWVSTPILDPHQPSGIAILKIRKDDPDLHYPDPRLFQYQGKTYLTTLSHLRLAWSDDGVHFDVDEKPTLLGQGELESFGIEDARVSEMDGTYYLTYTAVSPSGVGVGMISTRDWETFERHGMVIPPSNKDCALFPQKIGGDYYALHRPSGVMIGGNFIWVSRSPDLLHWGDHKCIAWTRPGMWDSVRVGAGAEPILTEHGWLEIYHGANADHRYCLGALLLDKDDPAKVLARSTQPIMEPSAPYEETGFFGKVVFTNGHMSRRRHRDDLLRRVRRSHLRREVLHPRDLGVAGRAVGMIRVLFVCLGNICRSPMAEAVFQHKVDAGGAGGQDRGRLGGDGRLARRRSRPIAGTRRILADNQIAYRPLRPADHGA